MEIAASIPSDRAGLIPKLYPVSPYQSENCAGHEDVCNDSFFPIKSQEQCSLTIPWNFCELLAGYIGLMVRPLRIDQGQTEFLKEPSAESQKEPLHGWCNQVSLKVGGDKVWNASVTCETCKVNLADGKSPCEIRFDSLADGQIILSGATNCITVQSHQKIMLTCIKLVSKYFLAPIFIGYALHARGGWIGDLLIPGWGDLVKHVSLRSTSKNSSRKELRSENCRLHIFQRNGSLKQEDYLQHHVLALRQKNSQGSTTRTLDFVCC